MIPSGNSNLSLRIEADILNVLFLYDSFIFFHVWQMLRFDKASYSLLLLFKFIFNVQD